MKRSVFYLVLFGNAALISLFWWRASSPFFAGGQATEIIIAFGRLAGLLGQFTLLVQLMLVGRIRFIEPLFGHDKMNRVHRIIGYSILALFLSHPLLIIWGYSRLSGLTFWAQFKAILASGQGRVYAFVALLLFAAIISVSLPPVRRRLRYEVWYFTHLFVYMALVLVFIHQLYGEDLSSGPFRTYWIILNGGVFSIFIVFRFIRPLYLFAKHRFYIDRIVPETKDVNSVYIKGRRMNEFKFTAGQFSNYIFLSKKMWSSHPFSFSIAPNGEYLRISAKAVGDFTSKIRDNLKPGTKVIVDGPLGTFTEKRAKLDKFLFIAGGIGITPIRSMVESLARKGTDMVLLYGNRAELETALLGELRPLLKRLHLVLSEEKTNQHEVGYIDVEKISRLVPDFREREIYVCGPPPMMKKLISALENAGASRSQIHYERFALA
ncbi:MAG: ferric reductase-like transmembrane domain-containing protein [bacterium]|nr:ferric reductase-like transmembrane domain-containing protein [bacterium]